VKISITLKRKFIITFIRTFTKAVAKRGIPSDFHAIGFHSLKFEKNSVCPTFR